MNENKQLEKRTQEKALNVEVLRPEKRKDTPYFNKDFILDKLKQITNPRDKFFCMFLFMSGVRVSEAISIKKQDIDLENKTMRVDWLKSRKYLHRNVPIHSQLCNMLEIYTGKLNKDDKVFDFSRQQAWNITQKWFNSNPHIFRHSFAVNYLREGGRIENLCRLMGHTNIKTTMEYLKIVPVDLGKELETIKFN